MTVSVQRHGHRVEIVQKADLVPGSIGWKARLLVMELFTTCTFLAAVSALLFGQLAAGAVPVAETWIGMIVMVPAVPSLAATAFWEISAARPCRITISPAEIAVRYGAPSPRPFRITRRQRGLLKAEVCHRAHRNHASSRSHGSYNITLKSRIPYVRCGGRLIGPMDKWDAAAVAVAMNAVLCPDRTRTETLKGPVEHRFRHLEGRKGAAS